MLQSCKMRLCVKKPPGWPLGEVFSTKMGKIGGTTVSVAELWAALEVHVRSRHVRDSLFPQD
uniref:Uncharacterized protein n=1 Tax=Nelumbo nucifera TaxID=4432 RepID=A0A822ZU85_NELNU|nr:TPA_asm: hypothetical protein HUJ06_018067 [Nelumbo nucifera]